MKIALPRLVLACSVAASSFVTSQHQARAFDVSGLIGGVMQTAIQAELQRKALEQQQKLEREQQLYLQRQQQIQQEQWQELQRRQALAEPSITAPQTDQGSAPNVLFKVDGHLLGQMLLPSNLGGDFRCQPSDQFPGFQWCRERKAYNGVWTSTSIILSSANTIAYDSKFYEAAQFMPGSVAGEIDRLSGLHHERARVMHMPGGSRDDDAVIAVWGALNLIPLDSATIGTMANGGSVNAGVLVDFINNARESAKRGLPVYRLSGGAGFYWIAHYGRSGAGTERFGIADPETFDAPKPTPVVAAASVPTDAVPRGPVTADQALPATPSPVLAAHEAPAAALSGTASSPTAALAPASAGVPPAQPTIVAIQAEPSAAQAGISVAGTHAMPPPPAPVASSEPVPQAPPSVAAVHPPPQSVAPVATALESNAPIPASSAAATPVAALPVAVSPTPAQAVQPAPPPTVVTSVTPSTTTDTTTLAPAAAVGVPTGVTAAVIPDQGSRVALVIGNSAYRSVPVLENPQRDAQGVADALQSAGFGVTRVSDADLVTLKKALRDFSAKAEAADWAMVYYAGHGIEVGGNNYLVPVDAELATPIAAEDEAVPLSLVLTRLQGARKLRLVILDACRNNPFASNMRRVGGTRGISRGLAYLEPSSNEMVVFSAAAHQLAQDGSVEGHSPFAKALIERLSKPKLEVYRLFHQVTAEVELATNREQTPYIYGSTPGAEEFYFRD